MKHMSSTIKLFLTLLLTEVNFAS